MFKKVLVLVLSILMLVPTTVFGAMTIPTTLESPTNLTLEIRHYDNNVPYFYLTCQIPQSILDLNNERPGEGYVDIQLDRKIDNEVWDSERGHDIDGGGIGTEPVFAITRDVEDEGDLTTIDIQNHTYSYRARFAYTYYDSNGDIHEFGVVSPFSNVASLGSGSISINLDQGRLSGQSRIDTAVAVSKEGWPNGADTVILTRDDLYPDALTGTPLSKKMDSPILFTNRLVLTPATAAEIIRLNPKKVIILGGNVAVSPDIENGLKQNYLVQRIGGYDMYETAEKIAAELGYKGKVVIATGEDFHDALIAAPLAAYQNIPMLLTEKNAIPNYTKDALNFISPSETIVVGNSDSVSDGVMKELTNAKRYCGSDYYSTAVIAAESFGADVGKIFFATGRDFPDALTGSALAAKFNNPILFVNEPIANSVKEFLQKNKSKTKSIRLLGGEVVIPPVVVNEITQIYQ